MKTVSRSTVTILIFFLVSVLLNAQTPPYYHYTSNEGLASSTVFSMMQDKDGYMWFGTLQGLSRFDGKHFISFDRKDGLNANSIVSLAQGRDGEIYAATYENGINVIKNGRIDNFLRYPAGKQFPITYLVKEPFSKEYQKLYAYKNTGWIYVVAGDSKGKGSASTIKTNPPQVQRIAFLEDGGVLVAAKQGLFTLKDGIFTKKIVAGLPDGPLFSLFAKKDGSYYAGGKGKIYEISNNSVINSYDAGTGQLSDEVVEMFSDSRNNLWFSVLNSGFFMIKNGEKKVINMGEKFKLQNTHVNGYLEDSQGNLWVSIYGKGVFCLNNLYVSRYNESDGLSNDNINFITRDKTLGMFVATFDGLNVFDGERFKRVETGSNVTTNEFIYNVKFYDNQAFVCGVFASRDFKNVSVSGRVINLISYTAFCKTSSGLYLLAYGNNVVFVKTELNTTGKDTVFFSVFGDTESVNRINDIVEDRLGNIWVATGAGLCKVTNLKLLNGKPVANKMFFEGDPVLNSRINWIWNDGRDKIWFASDKGIAYYDLQSGKMTSFKSLSGFDLSSSTSVVTDKKGRIWIGNLRGLFLYENSKIKVFNRFKGLGSNEVFCLFYDEGNNRLDVGTSGGVSVIDLNYLDGYATPKCDVVFTEVRSGEEVFDGKRPFELDRDYHDFFISFSALNYSSSGAVKYRYRLGDEWIETDNDFINAVSLSHGEYQLEVAARDINGDWGKPAILNFTIRPGFFESIWFKIILAFFFLTTGPLILRWQLNVQRKKSKEQLELTERINQLKHQALSAMMNPHFVFNSLNSVQYLINSHKNEEANDYIAMMAKLMRMNLETAGSGFILLSQEISRLKLYLDLEKLRLGDKFVWEINTGDDVNPERVMIPNMIIQPFVENSLWHGIIESGRNGILNISFQFEETVLESETNRSLVIKVTDNGIGIQQAKKNKKVDHISKGIEIVEERLRLLSSKMEIPQPILFEDLSSRGPESQGTEIVISLPSSLYRTVNNQS